MPVDVVKAHSVPPIVEAVQFIGCDDGPELAAWCGGFYDDFAFVVTFNSPVTRGKYIVNMGDWVVKLDDSDFISMPNWAFERDYVGLVHSG